MMKNQKENVLCESLALWPGLSPVASAYKQPNFHPEGLSDENKLSEKPNEKSYHSTVEDNRNWQDEVLKLHPGRREQLHLLNLFGDQSLLAGIRNYRG
ncbi:hypothetical protein RIF29_38595 [Crotalaria pallida]|uniref:Uncharacterized protein n=1 Tax=Crotalaria pallida TaxID=3830 RepID=A0AAN9HSJ1_CROPI